MGKFLTIVGISIVVAVLCIGAFIFMGERAIQQEKDDVRELNATTREYNNMSHAEFKKVVEDSGISLDSYK